MQGGPREVIRRLRLPAVRRAVAEEFDGGQNFLVRAGGYETIFIASHPTSPHYNGRSLRELACASGQTVADWCCDAMLEAGTLFASIAIRHVYATETDLQRVLALPYCSLGSDGVVTSGEADDCRYLWNASSYGYAARTLVRYVQEQGLLELEDSIRRLSALPAAAVGLHDRGRSVQGSRRTSS